MSQLQLAWTLVGALAAVLLLALLVGWARRWRRGFRARDRGRMASRGERRAEALLSGLGYEVVERQPRVLWPIRCDDEDVAIELRADLVVEREGRLYVAEVKTGRAAPSLHSAATRRQLLEYQVAYGVESVLLIDMEAEEVHEVRFARM